MISVIFEFLTRGIIWILKSIFDMITFFLRQLSRLLRLFFVFLPVTDAIYSVFYFMLIVELIAGEEIFSSILPIQIDSVGVKTLIFDTLKGYLQLLSEYGGTLMYFLLLLLLLILFIPLSLSFIAIGTFVFSGKYLFFGLIIDAFLYLVKSLLTGKSPFQIMSRRYRRLFLKIGKKLDERSYNRWLSRHRDEFDNDTFHKNVKKSPLDEFYEEDYEEPNEYEEYDEYEEYFEEDYYDEPPYIGIEDKKSRNTKRTHHNEKKDNAQKDSLSTFNFFAGCTSMESATKKYKSLVKLYHPDNMDGDTSALQEINIQYNEIKKRLG